MSPPKQRVLLVAALGMAILGVSGAALSRMFIWPAVDHPRTADAIVVLSGDHGERLAAALRLVRDGVASTLVLDGEPDFARARDLCAGGEPYEVICLRPRPDNTRSEAQAAARLATERHWNRLVVVTTTTHVTRARLLFERCHRGSLAVVGAPAPYDWRTRIRATSHEVLGTAYALTLSRRC